MTVSITSQLTDQETDAVTALAAASDAPEGLHTPLWLSNELNFNHEIRCFFTILEDDEPTAFLTMFLPTDHDAEITAFTRPDRRRKGYFTTLLSAAAEECRQAGVKNLLFCVQSISGSGNAVLHTLTDVRYSHSEYRMIYRFDGRTLPGIPHPQLHYRALTEAMVPDYRRLLTDAFNDEERDEEEFIRAALTNPNRHAVIAYCGRTPVGHYHITEEDGCAFLYGVGIASAYRGRGYGKEMMCKALRHCSTMHMPAALDVDSANAAAFHIYQWLGFEVTFQIDYYRKPVS